MARRRKIREETIHSKEWLIGHLRRNGTIKVGETIVASGLVKKTFEFVLEEKD